MAMMARVVLGLAAGNGHQLLKWLAVPDVLHGTLLRSPMLPVELVNRFFWVDSSLQSSCT